MAEETSTPGLTHLDAQGNARMVDVGAKPVTRRSAEARGTIIMRPEVRDLVFAAHLPKGDALATARIAGILAAKRTAELIPLCHTLPLSQVSVDFEASEHGVEIIATASTAAQTGVEMEALTAVSTAALTLYDMIKAVDRHPVIGDIRMTAKSGGRSGDWSEGGADA